MYCQFFAKCGRPFMPIHPGMTALIIFKWDSLAPSRLAGSGSALG
jgi:hypothetical protein